MVLCPLCTWEMVITVNEYGIITKAKEGMNKIRIPKSFQLFGETITVEHRADHGQEKGGIGTAQYKQNKILLQKSTEGDYVEETLMENTYIHELLHFCLEDMGRVKLNDDEEFVTILSGLLHQAFKTAVYE